jgi:hypothetical protein
MDDDFDITVTFGGREWHFPARLLNYGYSYKIEVDIEDDKVLFEPDEERNWRALISFDDALANGNKKMNVELLKAIAAVISELIK